MKALFALQHSPNYVHADQDLRAITEGVRQSAAGADLARLDELGPLAPAVFGYVRKQGGQGVKNPFSAAALDEYSVELGRPVGAEEIQKVVPCAVFRMEFLPGQEQCRRRAADCPARGRTPPTQ